MEDLDGEHERFGRMYRTFYPRVYGYVRNRIGADLARDITAEVFLVAWRRRADVPASTLPWLLVTARNLIRQAVRAEVRQDALAVELARCLSLSAGPGADEVTLERLAVVSALASLSLTDRDALMMTVWDGLSVREAARVTGCSATTFTVRLHRARRRLAAALERFDADGSLHRAPHADHLTT